MNESRVNGGCSKCGKEERMSQIIKCPRSNNGINIDFTFQRKFDHAEEALDKCTTIGL